MLCIDALLCRARRTSNLRSFGRCDLVFRGFSGFISAAKVQESCGSRISARIYDPLFLLILSICFLLCLYLSTDS
jgi:hypothetical protein